VVPLKTSRKLPSAVRDELLAEIDFLCMSSRKKRSDDKGLLRAVTKLSDLVD